MFYVRRAVWQPFVKTADAATAEAAREWALSVLGGCHHVPRRLVRVSSVEPVPA